MGAAVCPRCTGVVALHDGRPFVAETGAIELWHSTCWAVRHARGVEQVTVVAPPSPPRFDSKLPGGPLAGIAASAALVTIAIASYAMRVELPTASLAAINLEPSESLALSAYLSEREIAPAAIELRDLYAVPTHHDEPIDELYPSLLDWIHPVADTDLPVPSQSTSRFGAERRGVARSECGRGHCGVDLGGPIGRPIVAVSDAVVVRIDRSETGRDGRSGRYVRLEHSDGALTSYMHLDTIVEGLEVGDRVDGGQQIGTLGATAIYSAAPHLHFSLEVPRVPGERGDHSNTIYVDPVPFLARAAVAHAPQRRHAIKPAF
jgi:murein DD-endopeptidase MepM/ murein hydrolase activator NlpD